MHDDARDALGLAQPHVGPGLSSVGGAIDAVADRDRVAGPGFARAHPDGARIARVDGDGADRLHLLLVEEGLESRSAVVRFPHAAARRADIDGGLAVLHAGGDRRDAAAHRRGADVPRSQSGEHSRIEDRGPRVLRHSRVTHRALWCRRSGDDRPRHLRAPRRKAEDRLVDGNVGLGALDGHASRLGRAQPACLEREWNEDASDVGVAADVDFDDPLRSPDHPLVQFPDGEERILVEEVGDDVSVLAHDAKLHRLGAVHVFGAENLDAVALLLPVDERPVEIGRLGQLLGVVRRGAERIAPSAERGELPSLLAVPGVDGRQALERRLLAVETGARHELRVLGLDGRVLAAKEDLAGQAQRTERTHLLQPAARLDVLLHHLIGGERMRRAGAEQGRDEADSSTHGQDLQGAGIFANAPGRGNRPFSPPPRRRGRRRPSGPSEGACTPRGPRRRPARSSGAPRSRPCRSAPSPGRWH